ncbi:MAG: hypothetical protein AABZ12_00085 [Planctomycetota bacterium]
MVTDENMAVSRRLIYASMAILFLAIFIGAYGNANPVYLAVGFIGEIILVATVHLSSVIQGLRRQLMNAGEATPLGAGAAAGGRSRKSSRGQRSGLPDARPGVSGPFRRALDYVRRIVDSK